MLVTIAQYSLPLDAYLARCKLQAAGIPCFLGNEHLVNMYWLYSDAVGGVTLMVPAEHVDAAKVLLEQDRGDGDNAETVEFNSDRSEAATDDALAEQSLAESIDDQTICPHCAGALGPMQLHAVGFGLSFLLIGMPLMPKRYLQTCTQCKAIVSADRY